MKKYLILLLAVFALNSCQYEDEIYELMQDRKTKKVNVCHYDADTDSWITLNISKKALPAHLKHGDKLGSCEERKTYVPDDTFEGRLIELGYDEGPLDDYVLTTNINTVKKLYFREGDNDDKDKWYLFDLTGIEDFVELTELIIDGNPITIIDLTKNINLTHLSVQTSFWTGTLNLDLSKNNKLEELLLSGRKITDLDLTNNTVLKYCEIVNTGMSRLNLQNGNNILFDALHLYKNSILTCVQVDDAAWSTTNWTDKDPWTSFSEDCKAVSDEKTYVPDNVFEQKLIVKGFDDVLDDYVLTEHITGITYLDVSGPKYGNTSGPQINELTGIEDFESLEILYCQRNDIETINLSENKLLSELYLDSNQYLLNLNLKNSNNKALTTAYLKNNPNLTCIQVDDANWSTTNWTDKDSWASFSEDCGY